MQFTEKSVTKVAIVLVAVKSFYCCAVFWSEAKKAALTGCQSVCGSPGLELLLGFLSLSCSLISGSD